MAGIASCRNVVWRAREVSCFIILSVLVMIGVGLVPPSSLWAAEPLNLVYFQPDANVDPIEANRALQYWGDYMGNLIGRKVITRFFVSLADFDHYLDSHTVELAFLNPLYILENHARRHIVPVIITVNQGESHYQRLLIVTRKSDIARTADLKGSVLVTTQLADTTLDFIENVEFENRFPIRTLFSNILFRESPRACLNALTDGQANAALIPKAGFQFLQELVPQYRQDLIVLDQGQAIPETAGVYFSDKINREDVQPFIDVALELHKTPRGQQSFLIFKADRFEPTTLEVFTRFERFLKP